MAGKYGTIIVDKNGNYVGSNIKDAVALELQEANKYSTEGQKEGATWGGTNGDFIFHNGKWELDPNGKRGFKEVDAQDYYLGKTKKEWKNGAHEGQVVNYGSNGPSYIYKSGNWVLKGGENDDTVKDSSYYAKQLIKPGFMAGENNYGAIVSFLDKQYNENGIKPEDIVKNYELQDLGNGNIGLVNKGKSRTGNDYIFSGGQWYDRNRTTGFTGPGDIKNYQQANTRLGQIQSKIDDLNNENTLIKSKDSIGGIGGFNTPGQLEAIKGNEKTISELRKEYNSIAGSLGELQLEDNISSYIDNYISGKNPDGSPNYSNYGGSDIDKLLSMVRSGISYSDNSPEFDNQYAADVLKKYLASLDDPYALKKNDILEQMAARGLSGSGISQENLGRLSADYNQAKNVEAGNLTGDYYSNKVEAENRKYQQLVETYIQDLATAFNDSKQTADEYWRANEARINSDLTRYATDRDTAIGTIGGEYSQESKDFNDRISAYNNLWGSVGSTIGNWYGSKNNNNSSNSNSNSYDYGTSGNAVNKAVNNQFDPWANYYNNPYNSYAKN